MATINQVQFASPYAVEQTDIDRRRKIAEAMQAQAMEPIEQPRAGPGGFVPRISPYQGLAKVVQALAGAYGQNRAATEAKELGARYTQERGSTIADALRAGEAQPPREVQSYAGMTGGLDEGLPQETEMRPGQAADPMRTYQALSRASNFPDLQSAGIQGAMPKKPEPYTLAPGAQRRGPDNQIVAEAPATPQRPLADNRPEVVRLQEFANNLLPTDPQREQIEARISQLTTRPERAAPPVSQLARLQTERAALPAGDPRITAYDNAIRKESETARQISPTVILEKGGPKLKPGERETPDGRVEAIPGSSEYVKQSGLHSKDYKVALDRTLQTDNAIAKIDEITSNTNIDDFNKNFGGYNAVVGQYLPGAQNMRQKLESLKSDLKAAGLTMMRSGGGIGSMTVSEWPIVERLVDSISPTLDEDVARNRLLEVKTYLKDIKENTIDVYNTGWGETQYHQKGLSRRNNERPNPQTSGGPIRPAPIKTRAGDNKPAAPAAPGVDDLLRKYGG